MSRRRLLLALSLLSLAGTPLAQTHDVVDEGDNGEALAIDGLPAQQLTPQILYQLLLAEIAGQRRQFGLSVSAYLDLARSTRDPRIARRAAEISLHARQLDTALEAARLWNELQPQDAMAKQTLANVLVATQRLDELAVVLQRELAAAGPAIAPNLLRLNRVLASQSDKAAVMRLVEKLTLPYLELAEAHFVRAQAAVNAKDVMRGIAEIDQALAINPDWEMAAVFKVQNLPEGQAQTDFVANYVKAHPAAREMRLAYARSLVSEKRYEDARREFRTLLESFPENAEIAYAVGMLSLELNDAADAEARLKQVVALGQAKVDGALFYLARIAEAASRTEDALRWYGDVAHGEYFVQARVRGAQILNHFDRVLEARVWLQQGRERSRPDAPALAVAEAQLLRERGQSADAYEFLQRQLTQYVDNDELLYEAGLAAERLQRMADAEKYFRRLIETKPKSPQGYNALGYSLADRNERLDEAEALIDKALALAPDDFYILDSKGWVLYRRGKAEQALEYLRRAYSARAEPEIAAHFGEVLWKLGRRDEASKLWREANQAAPDNAELMATMKRFLP